MTPNAPLRNTLRLHTRTGVTDVQLHAGDGCLYIHSVDGRGGTLATRVPSDSQFPAIRVDLRLLTAVVKSSPAPLRIGRTGESLRLVNEVVRSEISCFEDQVARVPSIIGRPLRAADARWLARTIPFLAIRTLEKGTFSAQCDKTSWLVACVDSVHGACAFGPGESEVAFSIAPASASLLRAALVGAGAEGLFIGVKRGTLVLDSPDLAMAIPTMKADIVSKADIFGGQIPVARVSLDELRGEARALSAIASGEHGSSVTLSGVAKSNIMTLQVSSYAGPASREISAEINRSFGINARYELVASLAERMPRAGSANVYLRYEDGVPARVSFHVGDLSYLALVDPLVRNLDSGH